MKSEKFQKLKESLTQTGPSRASALRTDKRKETASVNKATPGKPPLGSSAKKRQNKVVAAESNPPHELVLDSPQMFDSNPFDMAESEDGNNYIQVSKK